ncbi:MAG TPA: hypothetical protein P5298_08695 [Spirochaetia bacterium]|nr:hypothetical protein [Spirochaetales bacterium]HRW24475.1 hypothetical protein [Spirochaetia bacterium]
MDTLESEARLGMDRRNTRTYNIIFALAVVMLALGAGSLAVTIERIPADRVAPSLALFAVGSVFSYFAVIGRWKAKYVFIGMMLGLGALIRFVFVVLGVSPIDYWPLFAVAAGVALMPANYVRSGRVKPSSIVISSSFALLGLFLSIFSFGFSSTSFKTFIARWWPLLFIASGLVLLIAWGIQRLLSRGEERGGRSPGGGAV